MTKQEKIRVTSGADILAFIPHTVGYWPERSCVCIAMSGKGLRATMRLDLPRWADADYGRYAQIAARQLCSDEEADGVLIAIFGGTDWQIDQAPPELALFDSLKDQFEGCGLTVRDAWYVGENHWRSMECTDLACCSIPGTSNSAIHASLINTELVFRGSMIAPSPRQSAIQQCHVEEPAVAAYVSKRAREYQGQLGGKGLASEQIPLVLQAWERALAYWPCEPSEESAAFLAASLRQPTVRDAVMVSLAVSPELSLAGLEGLGFLVPDLDDPLQPPGWPESGDGFQIDTTERSYSVLTLAAKAFGEVLIGGGEAPEEILCGPNWARLDAGEELLQHILRRLESTYRAPILCILGWIYWCRGRGSWAGAYFELAEQDETGYSLAKLLDELLNTGYIALWARDPLTAWPGYSGEQDGAV